MNATLQTIRRNPWPCAIIGWFLVFGSAMAAWVVVAVRQDPDLVRSDYYEKEIRHQNQIDRMNHTTALRGEVSIAYDDATQQIVLRLPAAHVAQQPTGQVHFYRPSDARLDFEVPLGLDVNGTQKIDAAKLRAGLWKVRLQWSAGAQEFFYDQSVVLTGS